MAPKCLHVIAALLLASGAAGAATPVSNAAGGRAPGHVFLPDTLVPADLAYRGYRLHLRDIALLKQRKDKYLFRLTAVNTGARPVTLGPGFPQHVLQTDFEDALLQSGFLPLAASLRAALLRSDLSLPVAESASGLEFWVSADQSVDEVIARTDDFEYVPEAAAPTVKTSRGSTPAKDTDRLYASAAPIAPIGPPTMVADAQAEVQVRAEPSPCADLATASMKVTQRQRGSVMLQIELTNLGPALLTTADLGAGASLDIYLGGATSVTNASQRIARINLSSRLGPSLNAGLETGETITILERIDVSSATRYTSVVVAQIDPGQVIVECDETNNETSLLLKL